MHRHEALLQKRSVLGLSSGAGPLAYSRQGCAHGRLAPSRSRLSPRHGEVPFSALLPSNTIPRPSLQWGTVSNNAPQLPAAVSRNRQQHQREAAPQVHASSPEVQELLKRLVRSSCATIVLKEMREWREATPAWQQSNAAAVVGTAALQVLTRVLGPGAKLSPHEWAEVQVFVRSLVLELHDISDTLTLEQLSAVTSSLVMLLPMLGEHGREAWQEEGATDTASEDQNGQTAQSEHHQHICSLDQVHDLAATLPKLASDAVSKHSLPAVLAPVCEAYSSMLQLLQLTHTDPQPQQPGNLTPEGARAAVALYGFLSRTVLCAPRLARQLGHVRMEDLHAAVQVAVQYRLALPPGILDVPSSFWDAVRQRVDELVGAAREGPAAGGVTAAEATKGLSSCVAELLDARPLAGIVRAMSRDVIARREVEQATGGGDKKTKDPGGAEAAWLAETTAVLLRSHQPSKQDSWSELVEGVASAQRQLAEAERDLEDADRDRRALQAQVQQQQVPKRKKAKAAGKPAEEQQSGEEGAEDATLAEAEELCTYCKQMVNDAAAVVEDKKSELLALGVVGLRLQLDMGALLQLAGEVAEGAEAAVASGGAGRGVGVAVGVGMGAALEGLFLGRLPELHPTQLVQALAIVEATRHTLNPKTVNAVLEALTPHLGELSHSQQLDVLSALSGPGEQAPEPLAAGFLTALEEALSDSRGGLGSAPTELIVAVVGAAARWHVPLDQGWLGGLEQELMRRLEGRGGAAAAGGAGLGQGAPAAANGVGALRRQLLCDVVLPVVRRGLSFTKPDLFVCALEEWRGRASKPFPGLDPDTAALLLGWAARGHSWQPTPQLHKVVEALAEAALRLQLATCEELARILLVASRAVEATLPLELHGIPSSTPRFLVPAATQLLSMKPTINNLASAVAALYGKPRPSPDHVLLKRMLDMAQPHMAGARPLSYAQLLAGCVAAGWRPDDRWLAEHHAAAAKALRAPGASDADVLLQLLSALSAPQLAPQASSDRTYLAARHDLLLEVAQCTLQEPALASLAAEPDLLVGAVRQLVVQGARPAEQWVQQLVTLTHDLIPQLSARGLAYAAESLALLGAAAPAPFLDALLTQAGKYDMASYDPSELGLLLGGVHRLQAGAMSVQAHEVWGRAQATFLPHCLDVLPTYTHAQAGMVAGSVVASVIDRPAGGATVVDAPWLSGLLGALPQCGTPGALPPPPALLVDLLRLGTRVLGGKEEGGSAAMAAADQTQSSSGEEGRARELLLGYVQQSLSDLAAAATDDVDWPLLLRTALAAGVRPEGDVLQKYAASLAEKIYGTVRSNSASKEQLSSAVGTLEEAIELALMPALPWVPIGGLLPGLLADPKLLQACSPRQLALLCTYATQSGLGTQRMWERVGAEVQARGEALLGARGDASAAAGCAAIWYALKVAGCSVAGMGEGSTVRTWLEGQLRQMDAGGSEGPGMTLLQALYVLWVAHRLGSLSLVPPGVWAAVHAATDDQLQLLLPFQLAQLVELRAAAAADGLQLPLTPDGYVARVLGALGARPQARAGAGAAAGSDADLLTGLAAIRALAYLPAEELGGGCSKLLSQSLSFFELGSSAGAATFGGRVSGLSAADVATWASTVEGLQSALGSTPAPTLSLGQLRGVVGAIAVPAANPSASTKGGGEGAGAGSLSLRETATAVRVLMALSHKSVAALDILTPLLERVEGAGDSLATACSEEELCALASAIIGAGGTHALPRIAAAALVRLFSCKGVIAQLPSEHVLRAVQYGLAEGQDRGVGLPDALAGALVDKLAEHQEASISPMRASCLVHRCGASPDLVRRAARSMVQTMAAGDALRHRTAQELLGDLEGLVACGIREPVGSDEGGACTAAGEAAGGQERGADTPLANYVVEVLRGLAEAARQQGGMQLERDGDGVLVVLQMVVLLRQQLEALREHPPELLESLHAVVDSVQVRGADSQPHDPACAESMAGSDSDSDEGSRVCSILELAFAFGCAEPGIGAGGLKVDAQDGPAAPSFWQLLVAQYSKGSQQRASSRHGPYLLTAPNAFQLALALSTNAVLYHECRKAVLEPAMPTAGLLRKVVGAPLEEVVRHGVHGVKSLHLLQLALVMGLALDCERRRGETGLDEEAAKALERRTFAVAALWLESLTSLRNALALEVLAAPNLAKETEAAFKMLDLNMGAAGPIIISAPKNHTSYGFLYTVYLNVVDKVNWALATLVLNQYPPLPDGVTHWDDLALLTSPYKLDEASLMADLRRPPGAMRHPLVLPTHLRNTPNMAAKEAYVRSIAPALVALRRLLALLAMDGAIVLQARKSFDKIFWLQPALEGKVKAPGRWAVLVALVTHTELACEWLARKEVPRSKAGSEEERVVRVKERAAELLARVPWAGHVWEPQVEQLSEEEIGTLRQRTEESMAALLAARAVRPQALSWPQELPQ